MARVFLPLSVPDGRAKVRQRTNRRGPFLNGSKGGVVFALKLRFDQRRDLRQDAALSPRQGFHMATGESSQDSRTHRLSIAAIVSKATRLTLFRFRRPFSMSSGRRRRSTIPPPVKAGRNIHRKLVDTPSLLLILNCGEQQQRRDFWTIYTRTDRPRLHPVCRVRDQDFFSGFTR
jgi:hypothetical protein